MVKLAVAISRSSDLRCRPAPGSIPGRCILLPFWRIVILLVPRVDVFGGLLRDASCAEGDCLFFAGLAELREIAGPGFGPLDEGELAKSASPTSIMLQTCSFLRWTGHRLSSSTPPRMGALYFLS